MIASVIAVSDAAARLSQTPGGPMRAAFLAL